MKRPILKNYIVFFSVNILTVTLCYGQSLSDCLPQPDINYGIAVLKGQIDTTFQNKNVEVTVNQPIGGLREYRIPIQEDGTFRFEIPILCEVTGYISFIGDNPLIFGLAPGKETALNISFASDGEVLFQCENPLHFTTEDMHKYVMTFIQIVQNIPIPSSPLENLDELKTHNRRIITSELEQLESLRLSDQMKQFCSTDLKLINLLRLFNYDNYRTRIIEWSNKQNKVPIQISDIDESFYSLMKEYDMNDPYYLYSNYYDELTNHLLNDTILNIPAIGELTIDDWMKEVKDIMQELVGFSEGQFYDMLATAAFYRLLEEGKPLTVNQQRQIKDYFSNSSFYRFLMAENDRLLLLIREKESKVIINATPDVPNAQMMENILSKYKGSVVFVDFWATWCLPCLMGIQKANTAKAESEELRNLNVKYVYFTNTTSPHNKWSSKIWEMEGEHYYFNMDVWEYIMNQFDLSSLPSYLIFDTEGKLRYKSTLFMGKEKMIEWIKSSLRLQIDSCQP